MNKQILSGNIGKDAEVKDFQNGNSVINFSVADTKKWTDKNGQKQEKTNWIECVWYLNNTSIAQYLTKGTKVLIEGEPTARAYVNQQNEIISVNQCIVRVLEFMGSSNQNQQQNYGNQQNSYQNNNQFEPEQDLPF